MADTAAHLVDRVFRRFRSASGCSRSPSPSATASPTTPRSRAPCSCPSSGRSSRRWASRPPAVGHPARAVRRRHLRAALRRRPEPERPLPLARARRRLRGRRPRGAPALPPAPAPGRRRGGAGRARGRIVGSERRGSEGEPPEADVRWRKTSRSLRALRGLGAGRSPRARARASAFSASATASTRRSGRAPGELLRQRRRREPARRRRRPRPRPPTARTALPLRGATSGGDERLAARRWPAPLPAEAALARRHHPRRDGAKRAIDVVPLIPNASVAVAAFKCDNP